MKKLLVFTIFIFLIIQIFAQKEFRPYFNHGEPWEFQEFNPSTSKKEQDSLIKLYNIEARRVYLIDKNGNKKLHSLSSFDSNQNEFSIWQLNKKRIKHESQLVTNSHRVYQWEKWGGRSKQYNTYQTINGKKYLKDKINISKNKLKSRTEYFWSNSGRIDSTYWYKKNQNNPHRVTHYLYKNNKLAETKTYIKGELKTIRKYDCEPLGKIQKKVETSKSCKNTEFDKDGNRIEITEYTNSKGQTRVWKITFIGKTSKVFRNESFDYKGRPNYFEEVTDTTKITKFFKKGKVRSETVQKFKNNRLIEGIRYHKEKLSSRRIYTYNKNGQETSSKVFSGKKQKWSYTTTTEYNTQGLISKTVFKNKRGSSISLREYN